MVHPAAVLLVLAVVIYGADSKTVTLDMNTRSHPITLEIPKSGWPGVSNVRYEVSGRHPKVIMAAWPWELYSETAHDKTIEVLDQSGWRPGLSRDEQKTQYLAYNDYLVVPHHTIKAEFAHTPSFDEFSIGLSRESAIWREFPHGATFCEHTQILYLEPHRLTSCLGDHIATLKCSESGPLTCTLSGKENFGVVLNGDRIKKGLYDISLSPFDHRIEMGEALWPACERLLSTYYLNRASIALGPFPSGLNITTSGRDLVPPSLRGESRLTRYFLYCNESSAGNRDMTIGLLRTGVSFYYSPESHTLEIHRTRKNTMKNTWEDVIVLNVCIFCLMHFFADQEKHIYDKFTIGPEFLGIFVALAGLALQNSSDGVHYRVADYANGPLATHTLSLLVVLLVCGHLSCLGLLFARTPVTDPVTQKKSSGLEKHLMIKCETFRRMTTEISLLSSIFLQVASGSMTMWDSYVTFLVGLVMVYNASYRCAEVCIGSLLHYHTEGIMQNNSIIIQLFSLVSLGVNSWVFYTISALPATDPISGLSEHGVEVASLAVTVAISFGLIGLASNYITNRGLSVLREKMKKAE